MKTTYLDPMVGQYVLAHTTQPDDLLEELRVATRELTGERAGMQITPDEGRFLTMITQLSRARTAVEIGTFTGYSAICLARGLAPGGRLLCHDISEEWTTIARHFWDKAGLSHLIDLRLGPAAETLKNLPEEPALDLVFIDADKSNYQRYYHLVMPHLASGGLILADNTLWSGLVADPHAGDEATILMREFNDMVLHDDRVTSVILPIADGLTLIRKN
ncbi:O-methyltransferase [Sinosporangium siamense]|nr:class I SAM-dependent methyltransferase [Sinosporangium siamense]